MEGLEEVPGKAGKSWGGPEKVPGMSLGGPWKVPGRSLGGSGEVPGDTCDNFLGTLGLE